MMNSLTIDVEDWYNILDSDAVPPIEKWGELEDRVEPSMDRILNLLSEANIKSTFFWLGWTAERHKNLVRRCIEEGHEVASHGYGHVLAYQVGRKAFKEDIVRAKQLLEDITGTPVVGFRAPGFGITNDTNWAFGEIKAAGYVYDSSVFPTNRGHGGYLNAPSEPYIMSTSAGDLTEIPMSLVDVFGKKVSLFGGGYLRLAPIPLIRWGIKKLYQVKQPLIVYLHPREVDPGHPRLPLSAMRRFKCYVNLKSTVPKLRWLTQNYSFIPMREIAAKVDKTEVLACSDAA